NLGSGFWIDSSNGFTIGPQANPNWLAVTTLSPSANFWTFAPGGLSSALSGNQKYLIVAEAIAPSGLTQSSFAVGISSIQVIIDTAAPNVTITFPSPAGTPSYQ